MTTSTNFRLLRCSKDCEHRRRLKSRNTVRLSSAMIVRQQARHRLSIAERSPRRALHLRCQLIEAKRIRLQRLQLRRSRCPWLSHHQASRQHLTASMTFCHDRLRHRRCLRDRHRHHRRRSAVPLQQLHRLRQSKYRPAVWHLWLAAAMLWSAVRRNHRS